MPESVFQTKQTAMLAAARDMLTDATVARCVLASAGCVTKECKAMMETALSLHSSKDPSMWPVSEALPYV